MALPSKAVDDFCRLCAVESRSGVIIYSAEGENLCLEEKIINCLRIEVSRDDMLPKRVCQSCNLLLEDYCRFSERASQVQQTLYYLLGLHLPNPHEQDEGLCFVDDGVKLESSAIKKELDEFITHQGNIHSEGEKFDSLLLRENPVRDQKNYYDERQAKKIENHKNVEVGEIVIGSYVGEENEVKQIHRRKMLVPKKSILDKAIEGNESNEVDCLVEENEDSLDYFKTQDFQQEKNLFQDLNEENYEVELLSSEEEEEEEEESKKLVTEWKNHWGILCEQCKNVLGDRLQFEKHYRCLHNKKPVYTCSYCKKSLDKYASYKLHIFEHINSGRFKCKFCNKKFLTKDMLQIHLAFLHGQMKIQICEECGKSFTSQSRLDFHKKKHKKPTREEHRCTECGKILQTRGGLAAHKSVHKLGRHFMCHICGKTFTQKINMQQHVKHHKGERPHMCDVCDKSFAEKSHLKRHKSFHTKDRPFQCPVCEKMYKTERCLKVHSQIHRNSRPYVCSYCGKGFLSSTKLKQHHNCHTGERPFACKYCERTFTNYPNWLKHTRRRHKVDHKTGLSLKEESQPAGSAIAPDRVAARENLEISNSAIGKARGGRGDPPNPQNERAKTTSGLSTSSPCRPGPLPEFVEMPEVVEVKDDGGRDSVKSQNSAFNVMGPSVLSQSHFQFVQEGICHRYQMNLLPNFLSSQIVYSDQM